MTFPRYFIFCKILLYFKLLPIEKAPLLSLIRTDNHVLNKVVAALASLCCEVEFLQHNVETQFYPAILLYGEKVGLTAKNEEETSESNEAHAQLMISRILPCLQELSCFIEHCYEVVRNFVHQLAALYTASQVKYMNVEAVHLDVMFEYLGKLLSILIIIEECIQKHPTLVKDWEMYLRYSLF